MKKATWIILGVVVILGLVYALRREEKVSVGVKRLELPHFDTGKATAIDIIGPEKVHLQKEGDIWKLKVGEGESARLVDANVGHIEELLEAASQITHSYYVTQNPEKQEEYGLSDKKATTITIKSGDASLWTLVLGKNDPDSGRYAKLPDSNEVFVVRGSFAPIIRQNFSDWRNKDIWHLKEPDSLAFTVQRAPGQKYTLTKDEATGEWRIADAQPTLSASFRPDVSALASTVRAILNQRANGFVDEKKELADPLFTITAKAKDGQEQSVLIYDGSKESYWAKNMANDQIFEISKSTFDRINKPLEHMRDFSVMSFDKDAVVKISIAGNSKAVAQKVDGQWQLLEPKKLPKDFVFSPTAATELIDMLATIRGVRPFNAATDKPENPAWQKASMLELVDDKGKIIHLFATKNKGQAGEWLVRGNIDSDIYIVKGSSLSKLEKGINAFKKEEIVMPPIDQNTKGFESLPPDIQRQLLESLKQGQGKH